MDGTMRSRDVPLWDLIGDAVRQGAPPWGCESETEWADVVGRVFEGGIVGPGQNPVLVAAVNPEKMEAGRMNSSLRSALEGMDILLPDGVGITWAVRLLLGQSVVRITGFDTCVEVLGAVSRRGGSVFFLGGTEATSQAVKSSVKRKFPNLSDVFAAHGYGGEDWFGSVLAEVRRTSPDALFVGIGSPRQELLMAKWAECLPEVRWVQGVGGTIDILAGAKRRAPGWVQGLRVEWLYRLVQEPRRLRRQVALPRFAWHVLAQRYHQVRQDSGDT